MGEGWVALFDGDASDLDDWREATDEPAGTWKVVNGILSHRDTFHGNHLFYDGPEGPWGDMELVCEFRTDVGTNSGVYFRTKYFESGFPQSPHDLEAQINNTSYTSLTKRTGSLIQGSSHSVSTVSDNEWTQMRLVVYTVDSVIHVKVEVNGELITDNTVSAANYPATGTICLQGEGLAHHYDHIEYRSVYVRHLPVSSCDGWDLGTQDLDRKLPLGQKKSSEGLGTYRETIAHYHFDGDLLNSVARDGRLSVSGNAELSSDDLGWMAEPEGMALHVDGIGDKISWVLAEDDIYPSENSEFTIDVLLKVNEVAPWSLVHLFKIVNGQDLWEVRWTGGQTLPAIEYKFSNVIHPTEFDGHWKYGEWMHLRLAFDSSENLRVYIDDQFVAEGSVADRHIEHQDFQHWVFELGNFEGYVDELRISTESYERGGTSKITFSDWITHYFPSSVTNDESLEDTVWGGDADPDGDGFTNLAEYFLGYEPGKPNSLDNLDGARSNPVVMAYFESNRVQGVDVNVIGSEDLDTWTQETINSTSSVEGLLFKRAELTLVREVSEIDQHFIGLSVTPTP